MDKLTSCSPRIPWARALQVEVAIYNNGVIDNLSGITSMTFEIKNATGGIIDTAGAAVLSQTISSASFLNTLTEDQWLNDNPQPSYHAVFPFLDTEIAGISMSGSVGNEKGFGLVVSAVGAYGRFTLTQDIVQLVNDGATGAGSGVAPLASYTYSDQQILALFNAKLNAGENPDGVGYALFDKNGSGAGLLLYVEVPAGETEPVLRTVKVTRA